MKKIAVQGGMVPEKLQHLTIAEYCASDCEKAGNKGFIVLQHRNTQGSC